jgi:biopolymer transport protein ExbD
MSATDTPKPPTPEQPARRASKAKFKGALRRRIRRNAHEPEINFLNITAMLDIMTIILVFLLKTLGESSAAVPQSDDLRLPRSVLDSEPTQEGVRVTISKTQLLVGDEAVVRLPARPALIQSGVSAKDKRGGAGDLFIVPLGNALVEARKTDKVVRQVKGLDPSMSEAVIIADETTPWRLLIEVLFTLGQSEYGRFHLMVMQSKSAQ